MSPSAALALILTKYKFKPTKSIDGLLDAAFIFYLWKYLNTKLSSSFKVTPANDSSDQFTLNLPS